MLYERDSYLIPTIFVILATLAAACGGKAKTLAPAKMDPPTLVGGVGKLELTLAADPDDGNSEITSREWQIDKADGDFSDPIAVGSTSPAMVDIAIPGEYIARARAINAHGSGEWSDPSAPATVTEEETPLTPEGFIRLSTGEWSMVDPLEDPDFAAVIVPGDDWDLEEGALPDGMALEADGISGVPTTPGRFEATLKTTVSDETFLAKIQVERGFDAVTGGAIRRLSPLGVTGLANPERATYAIRFMIPAGHTSDVILMQASGCYSVRVLGSNGRLRFELDDTVGGRLIEMTSAVEAGDLRDGQERVLIISADLNVAAPTISVWIDGEEVELSNTAIAGSLGTEASLYSVAAETNGTDSPIPAGGFIRWAYVEFGAARTPEDFEFDPLAAGSPQLFFGGTLADWQMGKNFGSGDDWTVQHGTWVAVDELDPKPRAFAGALGFGRYATGGRGKAVFRVTNTSEDEAMSGSLPWAIAQAETAGGGYIIIEAEGPLELTDHLRVEGDNITLDARRQPGLGFWVVGGALWIQSDNVVVRHMRSFPGSNFVGASPHNRDAFIIGNQRMDEGRTLQNYYFDHCDAMFSIDETFSVWARRGSTAGSITIDSMLVAESLHENLHIDDHDGTVGVHGKGVLINDLTSDFTFYGGAIVSHRDRTPRSTGFAHEYISTVIANFNATAVQVSHMGAVDFVNTFWMVGPSDPSNADTLSSKWIQGDANADTQAVYEVGELSGAWTASGGFDEAAMIPDWRWSHDRANFMNPGATQNDALFVKSGAAANALSAQDAFLTLGDRMGSRNRSGERHPFVERVVRYLTEDTPFTTGWHGATYTARMVPDEVRAIGATIAGPSGGALTVTLPEADSALPPVSDRAWTEVEVTVLDAYTGLYVDGELPPPRTSNGWDDGVTLTGSLAGGAVNFTGLPAGFYVARVTYFAGLVPVPLYTGRPVEVTE